MKQPISCTLISPRYGSTHHMRCPASCKLVFELPDWIKNSPEAKAKISKSLQETCNLPWEESDLRDLYATIEDIKSKGPHGRTPYHLEVITKVREDKCCLVMTVSFIDRQETQEFIKKNHLTVTHQTRSRIDELINPKTGEKCKKLSTEIVSVP